MCVSFDPPCNLQNKVQLSLLASTPVNARVTGKPPGTLPLWRPTGHRVCRLRDFQISRIHFYGLGVECMV